MDVSIETEESPASDRNSSNAARQSDSDLQIENTYEGGDFLQKLPTIAASGQKVLHSGSRFVVDVAQNGYQLDQHPSESAKPVSQSLKVKARSLLLLFP